MKVLTCGSDNGARYAWKQFLVIEDQRVTIVDLAPALIDGWNFKRFEVQGADGWPDLDADEIVAWKRTNHPSFYTDATPEQTASVLAWLGRQGWTVIA